jgi:hypothetical protein
MDISRVLFEYLTDVIDPKHSVPIDQCGNPARGPTRIVRRRARERGW